MKQIQFGPLYMSMEKYIGPVEFAEKAETWEYDSYWVPDSVTVPCMDAFVLVAAVAQRTHRLQARNGGRASPLQRSFSISQGRHIRRRAIQRSVHPG